MPIAVASTLALVAVAAAVASTLALVAVAAAAAATYWSFAMFALFVQGGNRSSASHLLIYTTVLFLLFFLALAKTGYLKKEKNKGSGYVL